MSIEISCARCGKDLTDAASREAGVGPICRNLSNALLATYIPANLPEAQTAFHGIRLADFGDETRASIANTYAAVAETLRWPSTDWRVTIKQLEWMVSRTGGQSGNGSRKFAAVAAALGYVGLASVWLDQAAKGKALIWVQTDRTNEWNGRRYADTGLYLFIASPRNRAGNDAIKAVRDRRFHTGAKHVKFVRDPKAKSEPAAWSVPASAFDEFKRIVFAHYPNHAFAETAVDWKAFEAEVGVTAATSKSTPPKPAEPTCRIEDATDSLLVFTPKNADFITALKRLPWKTRAWNPTFMCWVVSSTFRDTVEDLIEKHYGKGALGSAA